MSASDAPSGKPAITGGEALPPDAAEFRLCPKEPARHLLWSAGIIGVMVFFAWINGKIDGQYLFWMAAIFALLYGVSRFDESKAEEDRSVKVRVTRAGIEIPDKFSGTIPWEAIEKISSSTHKGTTTLGFVVAKPEDHGLEQQSGWSKFWLGKGVQYDITPLEGEPDEVLGAIRWLGPPRLTADL